MYFVHILAHLIKGPQLLSALATLTSCWSHGGGPLFFPVSSIFWSVFLFWFWSYDFGGSPLFPDEFHILIPCVFVCFFIPWFSSHDFDPMEVVVRSSSLWAPYLTTYKPNMRHKTQTWLNVMDRIIKIVSTRITYLLGLRSQQTPIGTSTPERTNDF